MTYYASGNVKLEQEEFYSFLEKSATILVLISFRMNMSFEKNHFDIKI